MVVVVEMVTTINHATKSCELDSYLAIKIVYRRDGTNNNNTSTVNASMERSNVPKLLKTFIRSYY